eukprot:TRINITY_DN4435_c0_g1_i10.p1 TRINITY_DN4435_c0_g1~~TRINITY_DN4435_c0_g1_i10.p1  ORF type:complete len:398 (-),score=40.81 TRINITY_DN4435_c0_g1_i10:201-1394(-)
MRCDFRFCLNGVWSCLKAGQHDIVMTTYYDRRRAFLPSATILTLVHTVYLVWQVSWGQVQSEARVEPRQEVPLLTILHAISWVFITSVSALLCWMCCCRDVEAFRRHGEKAVWSLLLVEGVGDGARSAAEMSAIKFLSKYALKASCAAFVLGFLLPRPCPPLGCYVIVACAAFAAVTLLVGDLSFSGLLEDGTGRSAAAWLDWTSACLSAAFAAVTLLYRMLSCLGTEAAPEVASASGLSAVVPNSQRGDVEICSAKTPEGQASSGLHENGHVPLPTRHPRSPASQETSTSMDDEIFSTCTVLSNSFATWRHVRSRRFDGQWRLVDGDGDSDPVSPRCMSILGASVELDTEVVRPRLQVKAGQVELDGDRLVRVGDRLMRFGNEGSVNVFERQVTAE